MAQSKFIKNLIYGHDVPNHVRCQNRKRGKKGKKEGSALCILVMATAFASGELKQSRRTP